MHSFFFTYISNSHSHSHFYIRGYLVTFVTFVIASQSFYFFTFTRLFTFTRK